jgi:CRP-like cAMP-binding protein/signal transduction histidine kinase
MSETIQRALGTDPTLLRETAARLAPCRYFQTMAPEVLSGVLQGGTLLEAPPGTTLIREGERDDAFYVLLEGELSVRSRGGVILTLQTPGDIIGEMSIISAAPRSADVVTDLASRLVRVSFSDLKSAPADPERVRQLFEVFSHIMAAKLVETSARARMYEEAVMAARELASSHTELEGEIEDKLEEIALYSRVIETSHDAVLITDPQGVVQRCNPAAKRLFPQLEAAGSGQGLPMAALGAGFARGDYPEPAPRAFWQGEWSRGGEENPFVLHVSAIPIGRGDAVTGLAFQCRDITLQKQRALDLERMVDERAREVRSLLDNMDEGLFTVSAEGRILPGCSAATARLIGPAPEGALLAARLGLDDAAGEQMRANLALLLDPQVRVDWGDLARLIPSQYEPQPGRWLRARFLPVRSGEGGPVQRVMVILHDITGEKALAQDVASAAARQERIVSILQERENFELFRGEALRLLGEARAAVGGLQVARRGEVDALFRTLHTLKGSGALFGLREFAQQAHDSEDILRDLREQRDQPVDTAHRLALLNGLERLERLLAEAWDEVRRLLGEEEGARNVTLSEERLARICADALALVPQPAAPAVQGELARLRRVPAARLMRRYRSVVERIAERLGKDVALHILEPEPCELVPEFFQQVDPAFLHLLRNAVDHGVEAPEEREAAGKPAQARIVLGAKPQNGRLVFTVADDGRGIDAQRILEVARRRGFVQAEKAAALTQQQILQLLFVPGFSSAGEVTDLSGRGVGLDVVKTEVERLGGRVLLETEPGRGTTFRLVYALAAAARQPAGTGQGPA